jgi:type IV pilus assembly protein PilQ
MTPQAPSRAPQKFSGEPISVNLKDVDLHDFFRLIHEISGLNVVVDPSVRGTLTIVLDDVPWDQALDIVLRNNDLDKQLDGNVLRIATKSTLRKEAEENRDLAKAQAEAADVVTTTRVLSYAKATDMAGTLKKFLSSRGDIIADDRSNTLIIRDIPSTLPVMDNLIRQLDRKSQQVEIEARVVAANRSFSREIGTQFGFAGANPDGKNIIGGTSAVGTSPVIRNSPPLPVPPIVVGGGTSGGSIPLASNLGTGAPTSGIQYSFSSANFALDMIITAAEDRGVGKLLSKPKVITQNNEKASVKQGTKIPVSTIVNNTVSVQFVNAVLELDVTPQITADGTIFMDVTVENDQVDAAIPRIQGIPAIDTQSAETKVTVNDGATVVIGGIIVTQQRTDIQQVPIVGSVPLLGNLFKHTTVSSTSQELLFFLTPRILPS